MFPESGHRAYLMSFSACLSEACLLTLVTCTSFIPITVTVLVTPARWLCRFSCCFGRFLSSCNGAAISCWLPYPSRFTNASSTMCPNFAEFMRSSTWFCLTGVFANMICTHLIPLAAAVTLTPSWWLSCLCSCFCCSCSSCCGCSKGFG